MRQDSITEEIRAIRRSLAAACGNDVRKIVAEAQRLESTDGRRYQTLPRQPNSGPRRYPQIGTKSVDFTAPETDN